MTTFTRDESRRVDALAQSRLLLPGDLLMENAGASVARATESLARSAGLGRVVVLCGTGNNGGDGFVAARHLLGRLDLSVLLIGRIAAVGGDARKNLERLRALSVPVAEVESARSVAAALSAPPPSIVVDALFGTGLTRPVAGLALDVIEAVNGSCRPVVAIDLPSGLDCDTGEVLGAAIFATRTITFVAAKAGFSLGRGPEHVGTVEIATIGFPPAALAPGAR